MLPEAMLPIRSHMFTGIAYTISKVAARCGVTITLSVIGSQIRKFIRNKMEEKKKKKS